MYVIAIYDVSSERCTKMLKLCRRYLHWVQNSVFEGQLSEVLLKELIHESKKIIKDNDSFIIFKNTGFRSMDKEIIGTKRSDISQFL